MWRLWGTPGQSDQVEAKVAAEIKRRMWFEGRPSDRCGSRLDDTGSVGRKGKSGPSGLQLLVFTAA